MTKQQQIVILSHLVEYWYVSVNIKLYLNIDPSRTVIYIVYVHIALQKYLQIFRSLKHIWIHDFQKEDYGYVYVFKDIDWFLYVKIVLHPRNKFYLAMVHDPFNMLSNSQCKYLIEDFAPMYIRNTGSLNCSVFLWFLYQGDANLIKWVWRFLSSSTCEDFKKDGH